MHPRGGSSLCVQWTGGKSQKIEQLSLTKAETTREPAACSQGCSLQAGPTLCSAGPPSQKPLAGCPSSTHATISHRLGEAEASQTGGEAAASSWSVRTREIFQL